MLAKSFFFIHSVISKTKTKTKEELPKESDFYATHGSMFILSKKFFELGGVLSDLPFLYGEEMYIAEQIMAIGGRNCYVPGVKSFTRRKCYTRFTTYKIQT